MASLLLRNLVVVVSHGLAAAAPLASPSRSGARVMKVERSDADVTPGPDKESQPIAIRFVWRDSGESDLLLDIVDRNDPAVPRRVRTRGAAVIRSLAPAATGRRAACMTK